MKKVKICIIDNEMGSAFKIWEGINSYAKSNDVELECRFALIDFNGAPEMKESIEYFSSKIQQVKYQECKSMEEVNSLIAEDKGGEWVYLLDVCLEGDEADRMNENADYQCASMIIYQKLKGKKSYVYSRYIENGIVREWNRRLQELYGDTDPEIVERETLVKNYFDAAIGKKILGI